MIFRREMPPTAGLPARLADFLPPFRRSSASAEFTAFLAEQFSLPPLQPECSGTACLIIALKTLQAMPESQGRDELVIPAYNCPLVVMAAAYCGLKIKLCDTKADSFDFDLAALAQSIGPKTLALLPTHLGGQAANVAACLPLARQCGAFIIEDAAQSFGAAAEAGIGRLGDIVFFSLAVGKGLTLFEGGLLTAKDAALRAALRETSRNIVPSRPLFEAKRMAEFFAYACFYRPALLPFVYGAPRRRALAEGQEEEAVGDIFSFPPPLHRLSGLRAACGLRAAKRLPDFLAETRRQAQERLPLLHKIAAETGGKLRIIGAPPEQAAYAVWPFFMLLMPDKAARNRLLARLWPSPDGVSRLFIHALPDYAYLRPFLGEQNPAPNARDFADKMFTISNSPWLEHRCFEKLCHIIKQALAAEN